MHGVSPFLWIERHTYNIDGFKPSFNLRLCALTHEYHKARFEYFLFQYIVEAGKVCFASVVQDREFIGYEAPEGGNALLAVQHFKLPRWCQVEIDKSEGIAFEQGVDNGHVLFAVVVNIMALVFGLDSQLTIEAEKTSTLGFIIDNTLTDIAHSEVYAKCRIHFLLRIRILR